MIRPEDLQNRVVRGAPAQRRAVDVDDEAIENAPAQPAGTAEPCTPGQPSPEEHAERAGGDLDCRPES
jgi:hypothetical protein